MRACCGSPAIRVRALPLGQGAGSVDAGINCQTPLDESVLSASGAMFPAWQARAAAIIMRKLACKSLLPGTRGAVQDGAAYLQSAECGDAR